MAAATRLPIPPILGIRWWWLLIPCFLEWPVRNRLHIAGWVPPFEAWWLLAQIVWLKIAEPRSRSLYWFLAFGLIYEVLFGFGTHPKLPSWADQSPTVAFFAAAFACILVFRAELEKHFNLTDPLGLKLSGLQPILRLFVFNALYTQYHFRKLYQKQQSIQRSLISD